MLESCVGDAEFSLLFNELLLPIPEGFSPLAELYVVC